MTVKDTACSDPSNQSMAKRQKVAADEDKQISDEMIGAISVAMDSKADMNIVEFSYNISDTELAPGDPISDSELPPRIKKDKKKKKKHSKEKSKAVTADDTNTQGTDEKKDTVQIKN
ncbi:uncharacterized protein LOC132729260 [Ruditapes philippinarum]|uniref:uncharacterized protein LOC132729260 n=1 Tax=Ruditapes philippinarum TaxID=129788 RepID=UPI00295AB3EA|nr:uncharacterized protein LOC132729260 [Ruditapes philippinarum]XP_060570965.1 uncharacterized protein LOC132729260 [Ruditapes philippinarum]XP_060570966.1 uncharacterized protein LOC132729260 [Ruditapes philippinarum]